MQKRCIFIDKHCSGENCEGWTNEGCCVTVLAKNISMLVKNECDQINPAPLDKPMNKNSKTTESVKTDLSKEDRIINAPFCQELPEQFNIGVDFGTSTTLIAFYDKDTGSNILEIGNGIGYKSISIPSVILLSEDGECLIGNDALEYVNKGSYENEGFQGAWSIKRCLNCNVDNDGECINKKNVSLNFCDGFGNWKINGTVLRAESISERYFEKLKEIIEQRFQDKFGVGNSLNDVSINFSIPPFFKAAVREKIRKIINNVFTGDNPKILIHEPTAACIAKFKEKESLPEGIFCIFDIGGGTTDITIFQKADDNVWILQADGFQIGGDDFDTILIEHITKKIKKENGKNFDDTHPDNHRTIIDAKETLSNQESCELELLLDDKSSYQIDISRSEFNDLIDDIIDIAINKFATLINTAKEHFKTKDVPFNIGQVFLVGGSSKIPFLRKKLETAFGFKVIPFEVNSEHPIISSEAQIAAVALGSGYPSDSYDDLFLDRLPYEIGLELESDKKTLYYPYDELPFEKIIEINLKELKDLQLIVYYEWAGKIERVTKGIEVTLRNPDIGLTPDAPPRIKYNPKSNLDVLLSIKFKITHDNILIVETKSETEKSWSEQINEPTKWQHDIHKTYWKTKRETPQKEYSFEKPDYDLDDT